MAAFTKHEAYKQAVTVVTAGLTSQTIKLNGPSGTLDSAKVNAQIDLAYLQTLITGLANSMMVPDPRNQ